MTALFLLGLAPFASIALMSYLVGRGDGRRAEQRRRLTAAQGIAALKRNPRTIRL